MHKEITVLAKKAKKQGWLVELTGGGHIRFVPPKGTLDRHGAKAQVVIAPKTGCSRGRKNAQATLKKNGLTV